MQERFEIFKHLPQASSLASIKEKLGPPLRDVGSGLHVWEYEFGRNRSGTIGHNGRQIVYLSYLDESGLHNVVFDPAKAVQFYWQTWYEFATLSLFCRGPESRNVGAPVETLTDYIFEVTNPPQRLVLTRSRRDWDAEDHETKFTTQSGSFHLKLHRLPVDREAGELTVEQT